MMHRVFYLALCCGLFAATTLSASAQEMTFQRQILPNGEYTPGEEITVLLTINYTGSAPLTAVAHREYLPEGWVYVELTGGTLTPANVGLEENNRVEFLFIQEPELPGTLEYSVMVPAEETGPQTITGQVLYRTTGAEQQSPNVTSTIYSLGETKEEAMCGCAPASGGSAGLLGDGLITLALCGILLFSQRRRVAALRVG